MRRSTSFRTTSERPYSDQTRFRNFFSADARLMKDFKVTPKYSVRLSVTGFNLTNHFNPLAVHDNTADPHYGCVFRQLP